MKQLLVIRQFIRLSIMKYFSPAILYKKFRKKYCTFVQEKQEKTRKIDLFLKKQQRISSFEKKIVF